MADVAMMLRRQAHWVALLLGAALPCAFAPLSWYVLAIVVPACLFGLWYQQSPRRAFFIGFMFGLGMFGAGVSWVYVAIHVFGDTPAVLAGFLTFLFVAFLALLPACQGWWTAWCVRRWPVTQAHAVIAFLFIMPMNWLLFEWIRSWLLTGFPWLNLGYSQTDSPLIAYAPLFGVYGIALLVVLSAGVLSVLTYKAKYRVYLIGAIMMLWGVGAVLKTYEWTAPIDDPLSVAIVQGNQDQITKWDADKIFSQMDTYLQMSEPLWEEHDLIIWPENALTILYSDVPFDYKLALLDKVQTHKTDLILGLPYGDHETYHSSLLLLGAEGGVYHKRHLVPFGEYPPLQFIRGLAKFFNLPMSDFKPGERHQKHLIAAGQMLAPSICYEDAFGEEVIDFLPSATLLVNGSNNAWYGDSWAPHQHLQIARMRAVETGRMLMRATTNGISAVIDHHGKLLEQSPQFAAHVISTEVQPRQGATPYVRTGNWPILILLAVSVMIMLLVPYERGRTPAKRDTV